MIRGCRLTLNWCILSQLVLVLSVQATLDDLGRVPRHGPDHNQCMETYNFKHPHPCTPMVDCEFVVKWRMVKDEETVQGGGRWAEYHLMATLPPGKGSSPVWVALGFSSNSKMGDTDVISCWNDGDNFTIHDGYNLPSSHSFKLDDDDDDKDGEMDQLKNMSSAIKDDIFHCIFQRRMDTGDVTQDKVLSEKQFVVLAEGPLASDKEGMSMQKHFRHTASMCACNVTSCFRACTCPVGFLYQMLKLHGMIMSICFLFFIPIGAIISRYYKVVFTKSWFKAHVTLMLTGVLWSMIGLGLVLTHTGGVFSIGFHQILGITCLGLTLIQPLVGFFRPKNTPTTRRKVFNLLHRVTAISILLISIVSLFLGVYLFHNGVMFFMFFILCMSVLLNAIFIATLELLKWRHSFASSPPPVGYHKVRRLDELSESEEEVYVKENASVYNTYKFEKCLLIVAVIQNLIFALIISSSIFYFDSEAD